MLVYFWYAGDANSEVLLKATVNIVQDSECKRSYKNDKFLKNGYDSSAMICAGDAKNGNDTCQVRRASSPAGPGRQSASVSFHTPRPRPLYSCQPGSAASPMHPLIDAGGLLVYLLSNFIGLCAGRFRGSLTNSSSRLELHVLPDWHHVLRRFHLRPKRS